MIRWRVGDSPSQRYSIGGYATSGPAAVLAGDGWTIVVVRGRDGAVWLTQRQRTGPWPRWQSLGGRTTDRPALGFGAAGLTVSVRGTDGVLWERERSAGGTWGSWRSTGRRIVGGPGAGSYRDPEGRIWRWQASPGQWTQLPAMPGGLRPVSEPFTFDHFSAGVLIRGSDGQCWSYELGFGWSSLGGQFVSGFAAVSQSDGVVGGVWIYGRGTNGKLYQLGTGPTWRQLS